MDSKMQDRLVCLNAFREAVSLTKSDCRLAQVGSRVAAGTPYGKLPEGPEPSGEFRWQEFSTRLATPPRKPVNFVKSDSTFSTIPPGVPATLNTGDLEHIHISDRPCRAIGTGLTRLEIDLKLQPSHYECLSKKKTSYRYQRVGGVVSRSSSGATGIPKQTAVSRGYGMPCAIIRRLLLGGDISLQGEARVVKFTTQFSANTAIPIYFSSKGAYPSRRLNMDRRSVGRDL